MDGRGWPIISASEARLSSEQPPRRKGALTAVVSFFATVAAVLAAGAVITALPLFDVFAVLARVPTLAAQENSRTVTGTITLAGQGRLPSDRSGVVVWLTPSDASGQPPAAGGTRPRARIIQQGKKFLPRVLAIRTGSVVEFPNMDPFFHNVFSLFDGRKFDLGLYEAGASRSVTFARPGINYIFCNIHPDMNAVVVTVDSEHFATSAASGSFSIADVPPGRYQLNVWHDRFKPAQASEYPRSVTVTAAGLPLGPLTLVDTGQTLTHQDKFGHDYVPPDATAPIYR